MVKPTKAPLGYQPRPPRQKINVTDPLIAIAKSSNSGHCAVAQGVAHDIPGSSHILVDTATIRLTVGEHRYYYPTPAKVQQFILAFDHGDSVEAFSFVLREGYVKPVARNPGVGGRPKRGVSARPPLPNSHPGRRTYGARSMTAAKIAAAKTKAVRHAP